MQQTSGVAILATQLATTDRRTLSQAWYSALHLAQRDRAVPDARLTARATQRRELLSARIERIATERRAAVPESRAARQAAATRRETPAQTAERRAPRSELARRIERAIAQRVRTHVPASFAISAADGRVHLLVRSDGRATRVLAVCAPSLRSGVERALAQARYALALRGIPTETA